MIILTFVWWSPKRRCHGNQLNLGAVRRWRHERSLLVTLAFDNGLAHRDAAFKGLNGNNSVTLYTNLVNFCPIISEFTLLKRAILPRFGRNLTIVTLSFQNGLKDHSFDFRRVISSHFCTLVEIWWDSDRWSRSLRHKKLYCWRRKFFWGDLGTFGR